MKFFTFLVVLVFSAVPALAQDLPIFDAHLHYSRGAWDVFTPDAVLEKMKKAGVIGALVSSTPDEGTQKLLRAGHARIVGGYRPYQVSADIDFWYKKRKLISLAEKILPQGRHRAFGEIHIDTPESLDDPGMVNFIRLALDRGLYFHVHAGGDVVEGLFKRWPDLKVLWGHAGFSELPDDVDSLLARHKNLWTELSYRASDIMPGDTLADDWRRVLVRHPDRFMIGSDTWTVDRLDQYSGLIGEHRSWLKLLPPDVAEKIAYKNAERLFGLIR